MVMFHSQTGKLPGIHHHPIIIPLYIIIHSIVFYVCIYLYIYTFQSSNPTIAHVKNPPQHQRLVSAKADRQASQVAEVLQAQEESEEKVGKASGISGHSLALMVCPRGMG